MKKNPIVRMLNDRHHTCFGFHFCDLQNMDNFKPIDKELLNKSKGERIKIICIDTGNIFNSLTECGKILGIKSQHLSRACKKHSPTHKMYFAYLHEYSNQWEKYVHKKSYKNCLGIYCFELDKSWKSCADCCNDLKISSGAISRLLKNQDPYNCYKTINKLHFCKLSEYSYAKIANYPETRSDSRPIICIETKTEYPSITKAEKENGIKNILKCCKNWKYTSGGYHWCFSSEINEFKLVAQTPRAQRNKLNKKVMNIETNKIYISQAEAARNIRRNLSSLKDAIKNGTKCGGYHWKYVE